MSEEKVDVSHIVCNVLLYSIYGTDSMGYYNMLRSRISCAVVYHVCGFAKCTSM
jgi:hypothetical protein